MTESLRGPHPEIPQDTPAIVLSGEAIQRMGPERRLEVARSLGILIGAHAEVISDPVDQPDESSDVIPPFSLVIKHSDNLGRPTAGVEKLVRKVTRQYPESLRDESMTKRAVTAVAVAGSRAIEHDDELRAHFDFHYEDKPRVYGSRVVAAITFKNPQALIANQADIHELVRNLGPKGVEALAELALVITGTENPQRQTP